MSTVFLCFAAVGGTILVLQFLLLLLGVGGDHDVGHGHATELGHDQGPFLKMFSLQALATFATFFGLVGLTTESLGWSTIAVAVTASAAGVAALWIVAHLMRGLARLQSEGNLDLANAIGLTADVYLRVPPTGQGHGRVMLAVQGRTVECRAVSRGGEIPTGAQVRVVERQGDDLLVVEPVL